MPDTGTAGAFDGGSLHVMLAVLSAAGEGICIGDASKAVIVVLKLNFSRRSLR